MASTSVIRRRLLASANVDFCVADSSFDEDPVKNAMIANGAPPEAIARALAAGKAQAVAQSREGLVLGCDQVLAFKGTLFSKPESKDDALSQLRLLRGEEHVLLSAAVIYEGSDQLWSHVGEVQLMMRDFSDDFLNAYLDRNWPSIQSSVGGYKLEEEGVRLFSKIEGDYFTVLGMPLVEVLGYLGQRGAIDV